MNINELNKNELEDWKKACKIAAQALEYGKGLIKKGSNLLDVAKKTDEKIICAC